MKQRFLSLIGWSSGEDLAMGGPFYLLLLVVMVAAYIIALTNDPSMRQPAPLALFTGLMVAHGGLRFWGFRLVQHQRRWLVVYFLLQGGLVFAIGYLAQLEGLILAFYLALVGESAGMLWPDRRAIALAAFFFVLLLVLNVSVIWGIDVLVGILPMLGLSLAFVLIYVVLYVRQVQAREDAQALLKELEAAHGQLRQYAAQVEELTISQERQRMARELHDTLAHSLSALSVQLEALRSLQTHDPEAAQAAVDRLTTLAKRGLDESRRAIQALRTDLVETLGLEGAIRDALLALQTRTGITADLTVAGQECDLTAEETQALYRILEEALALNLPPWIPSATA
jgi:NarL family two-component system sensor histidine kinase YdfH